MAGAVTPEAGNNPCARVSNRSTPATNSETLTHRNKPDAWQRLNLTRFPQHAPGAHKGDQGGEDGDDSADKQRRTGTGDVGQPTEERRPDRPAPQCAQGVDTHHATADVVSDSEM